MAVKKGNKVSASLQTNQAVNPQQPEPEKPATKAAKKKRPHKKETWAERRLRTVTEDEKWKAVERLAGVARGASIILWNIWDEDLKDGRWQIVAQGLSEALREYADEVDVMCFRSAGDLARTVTPGLLAHLLQKEINQIYRKE